MITNVDVVTVFNSRTDSKERRKKYVPTVIYGVSYMEAKGTTVSSGGVWSNDVQYKIRIPLISKVRDGRSYLPCRSYAAIEDDEALQHWTINKGDFVIKGEYGGEAIPLYEDALVAYAKEHELDLIRVTEYADNTLGGSAYTKHWRIGGK